ncbi:MAG: DegV family protein [Clostridia bacterium]|nr:DegV family protein [Clostridia bacterium]
MRIRVTSDSTCDLSPELIEQYQIAISPLYVVLDGKSYKDTIEITPDKVYEYVERTKKVGSTAALNVSDYLSFFREHLQGYDAIIHFTISSEMSSCYQNACIAAEEFQNVYVIDSRNLSTGIGHLVLDAAEMAAEGKNPKEIVDILNERKKKLDVSFVIDTLKYLALGGRCSSVVALGANLLNLKPTIIVKDGKMVVGKKYRMSLDRALLRYVIDQLGDLDTVDTRRIFVTDSGISDERWQSVEKLLKETLPFEKIYHTRAGCTVSNHCGPNTLGILFYRK